MLNLNQEIISSQNFRQERKAGEYINQNIVLKTIKLKKNLWNNAKVILQTLKRFL